MKKLWLLFVVCLFLSGCKASNTIYYTMYIASIGFEKTDEGYTGYFFLPSSMDVGNTQKQSTEVSSEVAVVKGKNIPDVLNSFDLSSSLRMNLKHISSLVLHESILNDEDLTDLISYIKESTTFDFNFYIFTTKDEIKDIYSIQNPNNESIILTMLCEPVSSSYSFTAAKPPHYLNFCRDYYNGKVISFALLEAAKIWGEESDSTYCRGVTFFKDNTPYSFEYEDADFSYLKSNNKLEYSDEELGICLIDYKCSIKYKKDVQIEIKSKYHYLYKKNDNGEEYIKEIIQEKIQNLIDNYEEEIDFLNLKYNNSLGKDIKIKVTLKKS